MTKFIYFPTKQNAGLNFTLFSNVKLGDAPLMKESTGNININITERTKGFSSGKVQLLIADIPSLPFDVKDTTENVYFNLIECFFTFCRTFFVNKNCKTYRNLLAIEPFFIIKFYNFC